jgi:outer membrane protein assembly factor BamB
MKKMKKYLIIFIIMQALISCNNNRTNNTNVDKSTLIISSNGSLTNFNLDENKINWQYNSAIDSTGNRNYFAIDSQNIFLPFESGKIINFDVNTGKIIWKQQIYGNEDQVMDMSSEENAESDLLKSLMPLFMTKPLIDNENIVITSTGQPSLTTGYIYNFKRANGEKKWHEELPTQYNFYAPVKFRDSYFVNSAVFLLKSNNEDGGLQSYGMFDANIEIAGKPIQNYDVNQFQFPIYNQMQSDDNNVYVGDEQGGIFCLNLDKNANATNDDISDHNNTFIKNPKIFKWIFKDEKFNFQENGITFLEDDLLYTVAKNGSATQSCIFALDTENGKPKWKKIINGSVLNWSVQNDKIIGNTKNSIFYSDKNNENFNEIKIESEPLSNIEIMDENHLIYLTPKGIEILDTKKKK